MEEVQTPPKNIEENQTQFAGMMHSNRGDQLIEGIISPEQEIKPMVYKLAGKRYNYETNKWESFNNDPSFNELYERYLEGILFTLMSRATIMTRIEEMESINRHCETFMARLIIHTNLNMFKYGIKDDASLPVLMDAIGTRLLFIMSRGFMQGERKFLGQSYEHKVTQVSDAGSKKGFWQGLLGKK